MFLSGKGYGKITVVSLSSGARFRSLYASENEIFGTAQTPVSTKMASDKPLTYLIKLFNLI